jgi:arabinofuranosyltransferase
LYGAGEIGRTAGDRRLLYVRPEDQPRAAPSELPLADHISPSVVTTETVIGARGVALGRRVHVVDVRGLADPIASRLVLERRGVPGHEKLLPASWVVARFTEGSSPSVTDVARSEDVVAARGALRCPPLRDLLRAVQARLTPSRFLENIWRSFEFTGRRIPNDPSAAEDALCPPERTDG